MMYACLEFVDEGLAMISERIVKYTLAVYVFTITEKGHGKPAWRSCHATRRFKPDDLNRITPKGEIFKLGWDHSFISLGGSDRLDGGRITTEITFHYHTTSRFESLSSIKGIPCYPGFSDSGRHFLDDLREFGFTVDVGKPELTSF